MNLLIMGLPGSGKGTQAEKIVETFGILQISTGDMFRESMKNETELGLEAKNFIDKGELVPDEVTNGIVKERLAQDDVRDGFLLDGFPRTMKQALALDGMLTELGKKIAAVINIKVHPEILIKRLSGRVICRTCGATYHKLNNPPKVAGICDRCGGKDFYQREDDQPETVKKRLKVNIEQGKSIIEHYEKQHLVHDVDGERSITEVFADVQKIIKPLQT